MFKYLNEFLRFMRPAFSRDSTYTWFIVAFVGMTMKTDDYGVTSIIRALNLYPGHYTSIIDFFKSTAWSVDTLISLWWEWLKREQLTFFVNDRRIMAGDHTKMAKDGRRMPAVTTLHQDSETSSKPSYFRGHHWGCISLIQEKCGRYISLPLKANIQEGLETIEHPDKDKSKSSWIVEMAIQAAHVLGKTTLILDAYFSTGPVFTVASQHVLNGDPLVHIIARAKKSYKAYGAPDIPKKGKRGPKNKYGKKYTLITFFDSTPKPFQFTSTDAKIYGKVESIRYLALNLFWKPTKTKIRFIWVESSRGRMILMCSDLTIDPITAIELYCLRVSIENMFNVLKNVLGGFTYHFWSKHLAPASRTPVKKELITQTSSNVGATLVTLSAIEKFVNLNILILGMLQLISMKCTNEVNDKSVCWFRTTNRSAPSENVTKISLVNVLRNNINYLNNNAIVRIIREKMKKPKYGKDYRNTG